MSRRAAGLVLGAALLLLVGGLVWWLQAGRDGRPGTQGGVEETGGPTEPVQFVLYFPTDGGRIAGERRELQVTESPRDRTRKIVQGLLAGPKGQTLYRPLPQGVRLGSVLLSGDVAYLDFVWDGHPDPPSSGATEEIQRVYSLVDSVCLNVPEVQRVSLLWNGFQRLTFGGHLDLSQPIRPDRKLIAQ
ncbi:MAG TPA: GerMN domain-containing protein [Thermoanaerobaculia bacterium]|nr:GerMN domain-containing protein [Thermoanaerobaculia bacterium]